MDKDKPIKLKVMFGDENYFYSQYGNFFSMKFPNVEFELIPTNKMQQEANGVYSIEAHNKAYAELAEETQPDVLLLQSDQYVEFVKKGKLYELEPIMQQEKFDTENIVPSIIQILRDKGDGKIYGLAPSFRGLALFYNVDLFEKYGIELPRNQMTWEEVLQLAQRFPAQGSEKDRVYGLNMGTGANISWLIYLISTTENLRILNPTGSKAQFDTESWRKVYQLAVDGVKSDTIYTQWNSHSGSTESNLFLMGKAGMTIEGGWTLNELQQMKDLLKDITPFRWGVVTVPVSAADPNTTDDIMLDEIYAINAKSPNIRAGWEFIKFVNGAEIAKMQSRIQNGTLSSRKELNKDKDDHDLSAFSLLNQSTEADSRDATIPSHVFTNFYHVAEEESKRVLDGQQTMDQAIANIQSRLQDGLDKVKLEEKAAKAKKQAAK
jgi:multiple sugar transport system substrate-binding protein